MDTKSIEALALAERIDLAYSTSDPQVLSLLAQDDVSEVRTAVARNKTTPPETLELMVTETTGDDGVTQLPSLPVCVAVAWNPQTSPAVLERLCREPRAGVRTAAARNPSTPSSLAEELAVDTADGVRHAVACVTHDEALLALLSNDPSPTVRVRVARRRATPADILRFLADDVDERVRRFVSRNPRTPQDVREAIELPEGAQHDDTRPRRLQFAQPAIVTTSAFDDLDAAEPSSEASNPRTRPSQLQALAYSPDWKVRRLVAANQATPLAALELLAVDERTSVRDAVATNPSSPTPLVISTLHAVRASVRLRLARSPRSPAEVLVPLSKDSDPKVREAVASNRRAPGFVLADLNTESSASGSTPPSFIELQQAGISGLVIELEGVIARSLTSDQTKESLREAIRRGLG